MRVLLVDDHAFMHQGLRQYVAIVQGSGEFGRMDVVGSAFSGAEALLQFESLSPHLVLLDVSLPDMTGLEVARQMRARSSTVKLIFISMHEDGSSVRQALDVGANAYLSKQSTTEEFLRAVRAVFAGRSYIADVILRGVGAPSNQPVVPSLTERQLEVLKAVVDGMTIEKTAVVLGITRKTVEYHRAKIMRLCGLKTSLDLYRFGVAHRVGSPRELQVSR